MLCQMKNVNALVDVCQMNVFVDVVTMSIHQTQKKSKSMKRAKDRCPVCECDPCDCGWGTCKVVQKR